MLHPLHYPLTNSLIQSRRCCAGGRRAPTRATGAPGLVRMLRRVGAGVQVEAGRVRDAGQLPLAGRRRAQQRRALCRGVQVRVHLRVQLGADRIGIG